MSVLAFAKALAGTARTIPVCIAYVKALGGDIPASMILNQLLYWSDITEDKDGWFYRTYEDWTKETTLSEHQVRRSIKALSDLGIVETKVAKNKEGTPNLHYRIRPDGFEEWTLKSFKGRPLKNSRVDPEESKGSYKETLDDSHQMTGIDSEEPSVGSLSEERPTVESTIPEVKNAPGGHRNSGAVKRCVTEGWREEMADWTQERVTAHFVEQMGKSNGFRNSKRREPREHSAPAYRNGSSSHTAKPPSLDLERVIQDADPAVVRDFNAYMDIGIKLGKAIGNGERKAAWPIFSQLNAQQRRDTAEDYLRIGMGTREAKYIPSPANHLAQEPWTRVFQPRQLPVIEENSKQAESDRKWQESADRLRIKHERIAAAKAARGAQP